MQETQISQIECLSDCFAQMGQETRQFVINTIKVQLAKLDIGDIEYYKTTIDQLVQILDGNQNKEGFQQFIKLVNDVQILLNWKPDTDTEIAEIKKILKHMKKIARTPNPFLKT